MPRPPHFLRHHHQLRNPQVAGAAVVVSIKNASGSIDVVVVPANARWSMVPLQGLGLSRIPAHGCEERHRSSRSDAAIATAFSLQTRCQVGGAMPISFRTVTPPQLSHH